MEKEKLRCGDVVKCKSHENNITIRNIENDKAVCDYFIGSDPHRETHNIQDLTFLWR